ncbi:MAG: exodeoxyribonuclease III [Kiritimatiellae bacterium]|nr:exodeoxyribonuclease III [Kiritimatiellia bacterium]
MKIATFNCNSIRSRLDILLAWLDANRPDYMCLQETKATDAVFPADALLEHGYHAAFRGEKSYNGVAILSREAADEAVFGLDPDPYDPAAPTDPARLALARFGDLHILDTYVPQGRAIDHPMYAYKLRWFARLRAFLDARFTARDRILWCGDLNVARHPIDVTHPETKKDHVCYHQDARAAFERAIAFGFEDVYRTQHPGEADYTFYDYRAPFDPANRRGWRIDYIFATPPLAGRLESTRIDIGPRTQPKPSDHTPLVAVFG